MKKKTEKIPFPELRGSLSSIRYPAYVELKLDGELAMWQNDYFVNKYGTIREANQDMPGDCVLLGELVYHEGKAGDLYKLLANKDKLKFHVFDVLEYKGESTRQWPLAARHGFLMGHEQLRNIMVPNWIVDNENKVREVFESAVLSGWEGIVVKNTDAPYVDGPCGWVKMKKKDTNAYPVVLIDPVLDRIEVDVCGVRVGCKCSNKRHLKLNDRVLIQHLGVLPSGSLRSPVFKGKE